MGVTWGYKRLPVSFKQITLLKILPKSFVLVGIVPVMPIRNIVILKNMKTCVKLTVSCVLNKTVSSTYIMQSLSLTGTAILWDFCWRALYFQVSSCCLDWVPKKGGLLTSSVRRHNRNPISSWNWTLHCYKSNGRKQKQMEERKQDACIFRIIWLTSNRSECRRCHRHHRGQRSKQVTRRLFRISLLANSSLHKN